MPQPSVDLIRAVPLFSDLDDKTVGRLADEFIERQFDAGTAIATEGVDGLNFFIVASGEATVTVQGNTVATLGPGSSFGEVALVDKSMVLTFDAGSTSRYRLLETTRARIERAVTHQSDWPARDGAAVLATYPGMRHTAARAFLARPERTTALSGSARARRISPIEP